MFSLNITVGLAYRLTYSFPVADHVVMKFPQYAV
jgi:hypothetical protein